VLGLEVLYGGGIIQIHLLQSLQAGELVVVLQDVLKVLISTQN